MSEIILKIKKYKVKHKIGNLGIGLAKIGGKIQRAVLPGRQGHT